MALAVHDVPGHTVTVSVANLRRQLYKDRGLLSATVAWVTTPCFTCKSFCTLDCLTGGMREIEPPGKGDCLFFVFLWGVGWGSSFYLAKIDTSPPCLLPSLLPLHPPLPSGLPPALGNARNGPSHSCTAPFLVVTVVVGGGGGGESFSIRKGTVVIWSCCDKFSFQVHLYSCGLKLYNG